MNNIKDAYKLQKKISRAGQEKADGGSSTVHLPAPHEKPGLLPKSPFQSKLKNMDIQV